MNPTLQQPFDVKLMNVTASVIFAAAGVVLLAVSAVVGIAALALLPSLGAGFLLILAVMIGLTGVQLLALGAVGAYVWRTLEESRRRPPYLIERTAGEHPAMPAST